MEQVGCWDQLVVLPKCGMAGRICSGTNLATSRIVGRRCCDASYTWSDGMHTHGDTHQKIGSKAATGTLPMCPDPPVKTWS